MGFPIPVNMGFAVVHVPTLYESFEGNYLRYFFQISKTAELLTNRGVVQQVNRLKHCHNAVNSPISPSPSNKHPLRISAPPMITIRRDLK